MSNPTGKNQYSHGGGAPGLKKGRYRDPARSKTHVAKVAPRVSHTNAKGVPSHSMARLPRVKGK